VELLAAELAELAPYLKNRIATMLSKIVKKKHSKEAGQFINANTLFLMILYVGLLQCFFVIT